MPAVGTAPRNVPMVSAQKRMVIEMKKSAMLCLLALTLAGTVLPQERDVPKGIPHLDHAFVIMMENHGYFQIVGNPNEPYLNSLINGGKVNLAT